MSDEKDNVVVNDESNSDVIVSDNSESSISKEGMNWYILQCYSGQEHKVKYRIDELVEKNEWSSHISRVLVPEEETIEIKNNKRIEKISKIYPGYVFIEMEYLDHLYVAIRQISGVAKFITAKNKPVPVKEDEVLRVLRKIGDKTKTIDVDFEIDEVVKVIAGPFRGYSGPITEIFPDKGSLKTLISIFGRETPVNLNFDQVEKTINN